jgi:hypothetical protein
MDEVRENKQIALYFSLIVILITNSCFICTLLNEKIEMRLTLENSNLRIETTYDPKTGEKIMRIVPIEQGDDK